MHRAAQPRHNLDGNRGQFILKKMNIDYGVPKSSTVLDDIGRLRRGGPKAHKDQGGRLQRVHQCVDEDGTPLVLELGPPLFGEPEPRGGARQPTAYKGPVSQGLPGFMASRVPTGTRQLQVLTEVARIHHTFRSSLVPLTCDSHSKRTGRAAMPASPGTPVHYQRPTTRHSESYWALPPLS